jgi:hypothetical protein
MHFDHIFTISKKNFMRSDKTNLEINVSMMTALLGFLFEVSEIKE